MGAVWVSRIAELLEAKGRQERRKITDEELADFVGVSRQTIHTWKGYAGVRSIAAEYVAKLCAFFGVPEWELWALVMMDEADEPGQQLAELVS